MNDHVVCPQCHGKDEWCTLCEGDGIVTPCQDAEYRDCYPDASLPDVELECRGSWWAATQAYFATTQVELDCRWEWWKAAFDFLGWTNDEACAAVSGFMWGAEYNPTRGW